MKNHEAMSLAVALISLVIAINSHAYTKIGAGYILDQPSQYSFQYTDGVKGRLDIRYGDYSLFIEQGIQLGQLSAGIYGSYAEGNVHNPSKVEVFIDYDWLESDYNFITGMGYKVYYQGYVDLNGYDSHYTSDESDKISARIALSKTVDLVEFGISHHSQWFRGAPFSDSWEYHRTEFFISYRM